MLKHFATSTVSFAWSLVNKIARHFSSPLPFSKPVLSVGNLIAGGVGKTEWVSLLAKYYLSLGKKPMVLMRGYKSDWENKVGISDSFNDAFKKSFPDEALLLLKKNPGLIVGVGKKRKAVFEAALDHFNPDVILLDDGYQQFSISKNLDILIHDFSLNTSVFRDFESEFKNAGLCISMSEIPDFVIQKWPKVSWVQGKYDVSGFYDSRNEKKVEPPSKVLLFSGIGNPVRFTEKMKEQGISVEGNLYFSDHHSYSQSDIQKLKRWQSDHKGIPLLTSLKDSVKLKKFSDFSYLWVEVEPKFVQNESVFWEKVRQL